jgi:hypothetical protein
MTVGRSFPSYKGGHPFCRTEKTAVLTPPVGGPPTYGLHGRKLLEDVKSHAAQFQHAADSDGSYENPPGAFENS